MTAAIAPPHTLESYPSPPTRLAGREIEATHSLHLAAVSESRQDIVLHTREGDTVTLSMDRETVAVYGRDARLAISQRYLANAEVDLLAEKHLAGEHQEWFGLETNREISLSIEGDLSEDEMRDIRKALHRIDRLIGRSFGAASGASGHGMANRQAGLAGLNTLSGIEVDIQHSRTIVASRATSISSTTYGADGRSVAVPGQPSESTAPLWQAAADEATGIVEETGIDPDHFIDPLGDLFDHWRQNMPQKAEGSRTLLEMMAATVMDRLETMHATHRHMDHQVNLPRPDECR